ncbi:MAG: acyltransferase family protein, partial [Frankia sp.]
MAPDPVTLEPVTLDVVAAEPPAPAGRHWPALDGLRALAVLAVMAYHAGVSWLPGGLLGVDLFFVLSGFLITGLLLSEWTTSGRIDLLRFWGRRARRLLPALLLVLLAVCAYARFVADPDDAGSLRVDALSTLGYVANWRFALSHQSYFAQLTPPSPLLHTWSLAVEEQFYVIWPLVVLALLTRASRRPARKRRARRPAAVRVRAGAGVGALASAATAFGLSVAGTDTSRIYYGTDTRAQALLVGAALAAAMARARPSHGRAPRAWVHAAGQAAGLAGAAVVAAVWFTVDGQGRELYRGGFLVFAVAVAGLVASVVALPSSPLARLLSVRPLRYAGRISYGLYLWHWPIFLTLTASRTHQSGALLCLTRFAVTFAVAALSFHLVEHPIRTGRFRLPRPSLVTPALAALVALVVVAVTSTISSPGTSGQVAAAERSAAESSARATVRPTSNAPDRPVRVLLVGDSVALTFGANLPPAKTRPLGVDLIDKGIEGCGIVGNLAGRSQGVVGEPRAECLPWVAGYRADVAATDPDVAALLVGRWEVTDRKLDGMWTSVGQPAYDAYLSDHLDEAITALSSHGAKVALLTTPVFEPQEAPDGDYYPETDANRVVAFNHLLAAAAARHPGVASVVDFGHVLTPDDQYVSRINGEVVRWSDGVHVAPAGSEKANSGHHHLL